MASLQNDVRALMLQMLSCMNGADSDDEPCSEQGGQMHIPVSVELRLCAAFPCDDDGGESPTISSLSDFSSAPFLLPWNALAWLVAKPLAPELVTLDTTYTFAVVSRSTGETAWNSTWPAATAAGGSSSSRFASLLPQDYLGIHTEEL